MVNEYIISEEELTRLADNVRSVSGLNTGMSVAEMIKNLSVTSSVGTANHELLENRDSPDQHPISAISGLTEALAELEGSGSTVLVDQTLDPNSVNPVSNAAVHTLTPEMIGALPDSTRPEDIGALPESARSDFAPADYGYAGSLDGTDSNNLDLNNCRSHNRYYKIISAGGIANIPPMADPDHLNNALVYNYGTDDAIFTQVYYAPNAKIFCVRHYIESSSPAWSEWEFENPPFYPSIEYRTTERYNGKAIYKKKDDVRSTSYRLDGESEWYSSCNTLDAYPVGSIYMSYSYTSPAELFGGTWESLDGVFLLAVQDTLPTGTTGGAATHTLTVDEMPSHSHYVPNIRSTASDAGYAYAESWGNGSGNRNIYTHATGGSAAHNNMPPYVTVHMWRRIA